MEILGLALAIMGAALAATLSSAGSGIGVRLAAQAAAGVTSEDPEKFGKMLILEVLPGTQGIYGFLAMFLVMLEVELLAAVPKALTFSQGLAIFFACMPMMISCSISAVEQGRACVGAIGLVAKRPEEFGKAMIIPVIVETYAVLSLLVTILLLQGIKF